MSDCCGRRITIRQPGGGREVYLDQLAERNRTTSIISLSRARIKGRGSHGEEEEERKGGAPVGTDERQEGSGDKSCAADAGSV